MNEQRFLRDDYPFKSDLRDVTPIICVHCGKPIEGISKTIDVDVEGKIIAVIVHINAPACDTSDVIWLDKNNKIYKR